MDDKKIVDEFKKLDIFEDEFPEYTDPYTFARKIEKCSILKRDKVTYLSGTATKE